MRRLPAPRSRLRRAAVLAAAGATAGCTIPITAQTLTGGAINAGAMLFVDQYNDDAFEGEGTYRYHSELAVDTLAALFEDAVEEANRSHMFPRTAPDPAPLVADGEGDAGEAGEVADGVVLARSSGRAWRPDDPPRPETFPERQWTPAPLFSIRAGSPEARADTLMWIVTHRASRQVAFLLVPPEDGTAARVAFVPYDPPGDVFLSVPDDHAQRNAVEALHQVFYFAALERFGTDAFVGEPPELDP